MSNWVKVVTTRDSNALRDPARAAAVAVLLEPWLMHASFLDYRAPPV